MTRLAATANLVKQQYLPLIKSRQTVLLALTGAAGYLCQPPLHPDWLRFTALVGSLLLTVSGCTVLNMLFDRDIDCRMERTRHRPLAAGTLNPLSALFLGSALLAVGLLGSAWLSIPSFLVIVTGAAMNVLVYTVWLKRRSAWSIFGGGVAGGMPILAGRVLAMGRVDVLGLLLALIIVLWIPSHNLTLSIVYSADYRQAGIPTVLSVYGVGITHFLITLSSLLVSSLIVFVFHWLGLYPVVIGAFILFSAGLISLAFLSWAKSSQVYMAVMYKYSSSYLLLSTLLLVLSGFR